jgi:hypothetical protein
MSAWRVGVEAAQADDQPPPSPKGDDEKGGRGSGGGGGGGGAGDSSLTDAVNRVTKWIPGDALALYVAAVTAFSASTNARPSIVLLIAFVVITAAITVLGEFATTGNIPNQSLIQAALAAVAFVIWSVTVPFSGWQRLDWVQDNQAAVAVVAAIVALMFCFTAEGISKRAGIS